MDIVAVVLGGGAGIAAGIWGGLKAGEKVADERPWKYWALNGASVVLGIALMFLASFSGWIWLWAAMLGILAGLLTGLKYGYGKSVGIWRVHDRMMRIDKDMRE